MPFTEKEFIDLRQNVIKKDFGRMNSMQLDAVVTANGPLLVLAGAGSGKTTVLVNRIACLIKYGNAYFSNFVPNFSETDFKAGEAFLNGETDTLNSNLFCVDPAKPWQILAITFTNKAAGELKERIAARLGDLANDIWAGTFHSICAKMLRIYGDLLGYSSHFTIYDTDDQKRVIKEILKNFGMSDKEIPIKYVMNEISHAKDNLISCEEYEAEASKIGVYPLKISVAKIFKEYKKRLKNADAMDFDDIILNTVELLKKHSDVKEYYGNKFKYIMVDEYQDTNHAQYELVRLLSEKHKNICVVGDDDQSIYSFRGATIQNILNFEENYPGAKVIRLEQNYRSTSTILEAANAIIANNKGRKGKNLWTDLNDNSKISVSTLPTEQEEAKYIANTILANVTAGGKFNDHAVLYRMNALSGTIENVFVRSGIPYKILGGNRFFDRKEIRDVIAYLNVINNKNDSVRLRRIINEPKRGIGATTISNAQIISDSLGISLFEVLCNAKDYPSISRSAAKIENFVNMINEIIDCVDKIPLDELLEKVLNQSGYMAALIAEGAESADRVDNVKELMSAVKTYMSESEEPSLSEYLEEVALVSDTDEYDSSDDYVVLMTLHSAKGLEFKNVFLIGMEENIFPGSQSVYAGDAEIEEERRLAYVGVTRAKRKLYITNTYTRMLFGMTQRNRQSRFLTEIPPDLCDISKTNYQAYGSFGSDYNRQSAKSGSYSAGYSYNQNGGTSRIKKDYSTKSSAKVSSAGAAYKKGMRVHHKVFGDGTVLNTVAMGGDYLLEIAFDSVGTKKLMANFVKMDIL